VPDLPWYVYAMLLAPLGLITWNAARFARSERPDGGPLKIREFMRLVRSPGLGLGIMSGPIPSTDKTGQETLPRLPPKSDPGSDFGSGQCQVYGGARRFAELILPMLER
jgi:hypothetical protein